MPHHFEDEIASLCRDIDRMLAQIDDLRSKGTTIFERRNGTYVDVTDEWLHELEYFLDLAAERFETLLARQREGGTL